MVNWHDPAELQRESCASSCVSGPSRPLIPLLLLVAYVNVIFACFGLYIWEVFQTSEFELSILQRRRRVRWHWVRDNLNPRRTIVSSLRFSRVRLSVCGYPCSR